MPANLPPDYYAAEKRYREASSISEKIEILKEMLAIMPKHKGTEHLQGDLKRKIARLQGQAHKKSVKGKASQLDHIPKEGVGQVALVGPPNSGKSSLLISMTNAQSDVADYPFSTFRPVTGMAPFEDVMIQLIDLPPVHFDFQESWIFNLIRLSDLILFTIDLTAGDPTADAAKVSNLLEAHNLILRKQGEARPQGPVAVKAAVIAATKCDSPSAEKQIHRIMEHYSSAFDVMPCSILVEGYLDKLKRLLFTRLNIIRVYTKSPGNKADMEKPYILPRGSTVYQAACTIHKELADHMLFARLWGSERYQGQRVERDHILEDKDILEIHT